MSVLWWHIIGVPAVCMGVFSAIAACWGVFVVVRQESLVSDMIAHVAYPGIIVGYMVAIPSMLWAIMIVGGFCSAIIALLIMNICVSRYPLRADGVVAVLLSTFFSVGLLCMSYIQHNAYTQIQRINSLLLGNIATVTTADTFLIVCVAVVLLVAIGFSYHLLVTVSCDTLYAGMIGMPVYTVTGLLHGGLLLLVIIGMRLVGVVLMSTMVIMPTLIVGVWPCMLRSLLVIAPLIAVCLSCIACFVLTYYPQLSTGPVVIVLMSLVFFVSLTLRLWSRVGKYKDGYVSHNGN